MLLTDKLTQLRNTVLFTFLTDLLRLFQSTPAATDFGPTIHNDFPAVFPTPALRGEEVRIECFAYGRYGSCVRDLRLGV